jgi:hypothetical protein
LRRCEGELLVGWVCRGVGHNIVWVGPLNCYVN